MTVKILFKFVEKGINLSPDAYNKILTLNDPLNFTSSLIEQIENNENSNSDLVSLDESIIEEFIKKFGLDTSKRNNDESEIPNLNGETPIPTENNSISMEKKPHPTEIKPIPVEDTPITKENNSISKKIKRNILKPDMEYNFEVIQDTSKKSYTSGEINNLITYFKNRYEKISSILSKRAELKVHQKISDITDDTEDINIIGMIKSIRNTKNNHKIIEIEDGTGELSFLVHNENVELFNIAEKLVNDEVIGLLGDNRGNLIIASRIIQPGVQRVAEKEMDFAAVFTSDIHIGSLTFQEEAFIKFIKWLNGDFGSDEQREIANDVKYLLIAGDIVDGIGVYPNQDKELAIKDIEIQYEEAARYLGDLRSDIKIIISPGNHDASRLAEPQPAIPDKYAKSLYELNNVEFISNPGIVSLDGINTLMYHGRGFDDMAMTVKGMSHEKNDLIMEEMLNKRHLAPIYGERTPLASELEDYLVIDNVPDVFHTGHVHINRYRKYNGVHMINSGTFQTQTEFQKIYNIVPTCGEVPVLHKGVYKQLKFI
ncbi:MAG: DNA-directed DNA polymerase II small subunit [Methanobrevibacter sp.]|nr:DNA-directed DNA polymerase II small subunit [Methanobrevibacter sp.]